MSSISSVAGSLAGALSLDGSVGSQVEVAVLKRAMEAESSAVLQLLQAVPAPGNPPHLGNAVDTYA